MLTTLGGSWMFHWTFLGWGGVVPVSRFSGNSHLRGSIGSSFFRDLCWVIFDLKPTGLFLRSVCAGILAAAGNLKRHPPGWAHGNAPGLRLSRAALRAVSCPSQTSPRGARRQRQPSKTPGALNRLEKGLESLVKVWV